MIALPLAGRLYYYCNTVIFGHCLWYPDPGHRFSWHSFRRLKIKMPPKDFQTVCMVKTSLDAEVKTNVQCMRWHFLEGWLYDFEKPKHTQTRRSATTRYRPWRSRCARVKLQMLGKWPRGLPHLHELLLFCACVRVRAKLRTNLETTYGEEISCLDLSLRPLFVFPDVGHRS